MKLMRTSMKAALCLAVIATGAGAEIWRVPDDPGCETIAGALSLAQSGDMVLVEPGIYAEQGLVMPSGVALRAAGGLTYIISDGADRILLCADLGDDTVIEGFIISGGRADHGGGLLCTNASPRLRNLSFWANEADYGGALYCGDRSAPDLSGCVFKGNMAGFGGAVMATSGSAPAMNGCTFVNNEAVAAGGAVMLSRDADALLFGCTLVLNRAPVGAGLSAWDGSDADVFNSVIVSCEHSPAYGGDFLSLPDLDCCDLYDNPWGVLYEQLGHDSNFSADPQFCEPADYFRTEYFLAETSPCATDNANLCGQIGAYGVGCEGNVANEPGGPPAGEALPLATRLNPCRPNPFNPRTTLSYELHRPGRVELGVYDAKGRRVAILVGGSREAGAHEVVWNGCDDGGRAVPSGVYFANLITDSYRETRRMLLLK